MAELSARGRKRVKLKNFALSGRRYPIHDRAHAQAALSRVAQHGTPREKRIVRRKVAKRYNMGPKGSK